MLTYNILKRKEDRKINDWKSYPGVSKIIDMSRDMIENGNTNDIEKLAIMMQCHESQQSEAIIATIAIIIGNKMNTEAMDIDERYRRAIGDVILWDTPVITNKDAWLLNLKIHYEFDINTFSNFYFR